MGFFTRSIKPPPPPPPPPPPEQHFPGNAFSRRTFGPSTAPNCHGAFVVPLVASSWAARSRAGNASASMVLSASVDRQPQPPRPTSRDNNEVDVLSCSGVAASALLGHAAAVFCDPSHDHRIACRIRRRLRQASSSQSHRAPERRRPPKPRLCRASPAAIRRAGHRASKPDAWRQRRRTPQQRSLRLATHAGPTMAKGWAQAVPREQNRIAGFPPAAIEGDQIPHLIFLEFYLRMTNRDADCSYPTAMTSPPYSCAFDRR